MAVVDDVISTGESLQAIERLVERPAVNCGQSRHLAEGDAAKRSDIIFWKSFPVSCRG
ncbi:MAG: hypothetical protein ACLRPX_00450 [Ruthenibacterium sp.]